MISLSAYKEIVTKAVVGKYILEDLTINNNLHRGSLSKDVAIKSAVKNIVVIIKKAKEKNNLV